MSCSVESTNVLCKHPSDNRRFSFNFEDILETAETISGTPTVTSTANSVNAGALTISSISVVGQTVLFWISGGTDGHKYKLICTIVTSASQTLVGIGKLEVKS